MVAMILCKQISTTSLYLNLRRDKYLLNKVKTRDNLQVSGAARDPSINRHNDLKKQFIGSVLKNGQSRYEQKFK